MGGEANATDKEKKWRNAGARKRADQLKIEKRLYTHSRSGGGRERDHGGGGGGSGGGDGGGERDSRFDVNQSIVIRVNRLPLSSTAPDGPRTQSTIRIVVLYSPSGRDRYNEVRMSTILRNR